MKLQLAGFEEFEKNCHYPHGKGKISIGYLEEVCKFIYHHPDLIKEDKLERVLVIEKMIKAYLNGETSVQDRPPLGVKCNYIPTYSPMLEKEVKEKYNNGNQ